MNVKFSKGPSASQVHESQDIEKSLGRIKKTYDAKKKGQLTKQLKEVQKITSLYVV